MVLAYRGYPRQSLIVLDIPRDCRVPQVLTSRLDNHHLGKHTSDRVILPIRNIRCNRPHRRLSQRALALAFRMPPNDIYALTCANERRDVAQRINICGSCMHGMHHSLDSSVDKVVQIDYQYIMMELVAE